MTLLNWWTLFRQIWLR